MSSSSPRRKSNSSRRKALLKFPRKASSKSIVPRPCKLSLHHPMTAKDSRLQNQICQRHYARLSPLHTPSSPNTKALVSLQQALLLSPVCLELLQSQTTLSTGSRSRRGLSRQSPGPMRKKSLPKRDISRLTTSRRTVSMGSRRPSASMREHSSLIVKISAEKLRRSSAKPGDILLKMPQLPLRVSRRIKPASQGWSKKASRRRTSSRSRDTSHSKVLKTYRPLPASEARQAPASSSRNSQTSPWKATRLSLNLQSPHFPSLSHVPKRPTTVLRATNKACITSVCKRNRID